MVRKNKIIKKSFSFKISNLEISLLIGIILAFVFLYQMAFVETSNKNFEELALGENTKGFTGKAGNIKIHCHNLTDYQECLSDYSKFGSNNPIILWLGNSQLHAINDYQEGQKTASTIFFDKAKKQKKYLLTLSQPNANLQEHLIILSHLIKKVPIENLILPIVFDDLREDGIRKNLQDIFYDEKSLKFIRTSEIGNNLILNHAQNDSSGNETNKNKKSFQDSSESYLNKKMEEVWPLWLKRSSLRGELFNSLYKFRNFVFNIDPTSTRKILPGQYKKNLQALKAILKIANKNNIKTLIYVVPIRNDIKIPYNLNEYDNFKKDIQKIATNNKIEFKNFENLVPNSMWGEKSTTTLENKNEVDFMHFKSSGHEILANSIFTEMTKIWSLN